MEIGILALQGAFIEHEKMLNEMGVSTHEIRNLNDLEIPMDGIIIPGGESTSMFKLLKGLSMWDKLNEKLNGGLPAFGTCAGLILLSSDNDGEFTSFQSIDISVKRNGYGRQIDSFFATGKTDSGSEYPLVFIRAPIITRIGKSVVPIAFLDDVVVACRNRNIMVTAFHPELTDNHYFHQMFVNICNHE